MKISLKAARVNAGLSQKEVSIALGVNVVSLVRWENNVTKPSLDNFRKLCSLYNCPEDCINI